MKKIFSKFKESGLFMIMIMLLCSLLGVADGSAMTADVVAGDLGGVNALDPNAGASETLARQQAEDLLLEQIDERITKIRPYDTSLVTIARHADKRGTKDRRVWNYAIETLPVKTTLTTAVTGNPTSLTLDVAAPIFALDQTIRVAGVSAYKSDGVTVAPNKSLILYVMGKDATTNKPIVRAVNGLGTNRDELPDIPAGTTLIAQGRAGAESQIRTEIYSALPTKEEIFLQKHMTEIRVTDEFRDYDKNVQWTIPDIVDEALYNMKRGMEATFWTGDKNMIVAKNANSDIAENIYFSEGVWSQAAKDFSFGGTIDVDSMVSLLKAAFTNNISGSIKFLLAGSDVIQGLESVSYLTRTVQEGDRKTAFGLDVTEIVSKFGVLYVAHAPQLDEIINPEAFFVLDAEYLRMWSQGLKKEDFDLRSSAQALATGMFFYEICAPALRYPTAHIRGYLNTPAL